MIKFLNINRKLNFPVERINLEPGTKYIITHPILDNIALVFHRALKVFICKTCREGFLASSCQRYFLDKQDGRPLMADWYRDRFIGFASENRTYIYHEDVVHPAPRGPQIEIINTTFGFACSVSPTTCAFASISHELVEKHVSNVHQQDRRPHTTDCLHPNALLQTLFS